MSGKLTMSQAEAKKKLDAIRKVYEEAMKEPHFSALIMGESGVGKTSCIATGRAPILIDSFDPLGTLVLRDEIQKGRVIVRSFWNEKYDEPTEFEKWKETWDADLKSGFIGSVGTYAIDSVTTLTESLVNWYTKKKRRENQIPQIQDYQVIYNVLKDLVKISSAQGCDFILTGHLVAEKDEVSGRIYAELDTYKRLKSRIPLLFTEKFVLTTRDTSSGNKYVLLTQPDGKYRASTQLGKGGIFQREEEPNLKKLLAKAKLPSGDKQL